MIKIGIMGSHGTGKSTLSLKLASIIKELFPEQRVVTLNEVTRGCPFPVNKDTTEIAQTWIFLSQMIKEIEEEKMGGIIITDRTALDAIIYSKLAKFDSMVSIYLGVALEWLKTYNSIIFLRPEYAIRTDGFRDTDPKFQGDIDNIFIDWINKYKLKVINRISINYLLSFYKNGMSDLDFSIALQDNLNFKIEKK